METTSTLNSIVLLVQQSFITTPTQTELANRTMFIASCLGLEFNDSLVRFVETQVPFQMNIEGLK